MYQYQRLYSFFYHHRGLPPYFVDNIQIVGNNFTSGNIPFGTGFSFIVSDSEDCEVIISGEENCPCVSEAGDGSNQLISVCEDETAVAEEVTGVFWMEMMQEYMYYTVTRETF